MSLISIIAKSESYVTTIERGIRFDNNWYIKSRKVLEAFEDEIEMMEGVESICSNQYSFLVIAKPGFDLALIEKVVLEKIDEFLNK
jgi:hypothetical protein